WAMNWDAASGSKGFDLKNGTTTIFNVNNGGSQTISGTYGDIDFGYGTTPMLVTVRRSLGSTFDFSMTSRSGGQTYTTTFSAPPLTGIDIYIGNQNDGIVERNI